MKKMTVAIVGLISAFAMGGVLVTPQAEAITQKKPAVVAASTTAGYVFIIGEDGAVWYTVTRQTGSTATTTVKTGNSGNVFETSSFGASGFVSKTSLSTACSSDTCSGIWAKTPGAGGFNDAPSVSLGGPICNTVSHTGGAPAITGPSSTASTSLAPGSLAVNGIFNILVAGLDKEVWYTLYDGGGNLASTAGSNNNMCGAAVGGNTNISTDDPFDDSGESSNTGWVNTSSTASAGLNKNCNDLSRTCVGIWSRMP